MVMIGWYVGLVGRLQYVSTHSTDTRLHLIAIDDATAIPTIPWKGTKLKDRYDAIRHLVLYPRSVFEISSFIRTMAFSSSSPPPSKHYPHYWLYREREREETFDFFIDMQVQRYACLLWIGIAAHMVYNNGCHPFRVYRLSRVCLTIISHHWQPMLYGNVLRPRSFLDASFRFVAAKHSRFLLSSFRLKSLFMIVIKKGVSVGGTTPAYIEDIFCPT